MGSSSWADMEEVPKSQPKSRAARWADVEEDDDLTFGDTGLGVTSTTSGNRRVETEYVERDGEAVKITKTFKQRQVVRRSNDFILQRREWHTAKFGKCQKEEFQIEFGRNTPVRSDEILSMEMNKKEALKATGAEDSFWDHSTAAVEALLSESKKKKYDANEAARQRIGDGADVVQDIMGGGKGKGSGPSAWGKGETTSVVATGGQNSTLANKYMPPSMREETNGGKGNDNRNENTIRVTNLSEDTREGDVQKLFATCGYVTRVFMPKWKEGEREGGHKGFAFVQFKE